MCGELSHYALELDNDRLHKLPQQGQWLSFSPMVTASVTFNSRKAFRSVNLALELRRKPKPLLSLRKVFTISLLVVKNFFIFKSNVRVFNFSFSFLFVWSRYWLESNSNLLNIFISLSIFYVVIIWLFSNGIYFQITSTFLYGVFGEGGGSLTNLHTHPVIHV